MALAEKRICEHTDATTISSADEFIVDSMANGTRNITMTNLENQILSTDTYSALSGIGDGTITGSIADIDSNLNNLTYDSTTNRLTMTGNTAFSGTIDSVPTAGSGNAVSSGGTKTYVDSAVSQLNDEIGVISTTLNGKCSVISLGSISATSVTEALGKAWDNLTVYEKPVLVSFGWYGVLMAMMYKYPDSQYGMAIAMRYASTDIYTMHVSGGAKSYATK